MPLHAHNTSRAFSEFNGSRVTGPEASTCGGDTSWFALVTRKIINGSISTLNTVSSPFQPPLPTTSEASGWEYLLIFSRFPSRAKWFGVSSPKTLVDPAPLSSHTRQGRLGSKLQPGT